MATLSHSESRRSYSWWWDSHLPKNSKWLQENLADIDAKVKTMIKLIDEEADSFARRAEMYYKKRPELMKLVEEFYRAYRALAERYDHAMGEVRHAHRTMAEAFPNQAQYMLTDESHTPGVSCPNYSESELAEKADSEVQTLRKALAKIQSDKDIIFLQYQKSMDKLSQMEKDLNEAQKDAGGLDERASKAEIETKVLKEALAQLKAEKEAGQVQYNQCVESIAKLETMLSLAQLDAKEFDERASKAEIEAKNLRQELVNLEAQKGADLLRNKQCLEKISVLETKITHAEENSRMLNEQLERAELEVKALRKNLAELNEEKESLAFLYRQCLEKISEMENEILLAHENSEKLYREIEKGADKLKTAENHCDMLGKSNQSLRLEAENLLQKIAIKDQALLEKHAEIERLQTLMHEEHSHFLEIESSLQTLQKLYSKSQQEQGTLVTELKYGLQLLKDLELPKQCFKEEMQENMEENRELTFSSTRTLLRRQQMEISKLKEIKEKLEQEFAVNCEENNALQQEAHQIKNDIQHLNSRYQTMIEQLQTLGLDPKCFAASVKDLQNENSNLKEVFKMERNEKEALREKSKDMDEILIENAYMEFSLSRLNDELDGLRETVRKFQESCQLLQEEKSTVVDEKTGLLSQLQIITESMLKLLEKNSLLEKSLSDSKIELEGLKAKSTDMEDFCKFLNDEKYNLLNERSILVSQLESVEAKLSNLEKMFTELKEKYADSEKDKESTGNKVEELRASILVQKEKHANHKHLSEVQLTNLENLFHALQEELRLGKIEFEKEVDKAVNAQIEMFILQSCIEDLEQKNFSLLTECEKHVEASKVSSKIISELETGNFMQLMEEELLLHEIRKLKMAIHQVCGALKIDPYGVHDKGINQEEIPILHILNNIEGLKSFNVKSREEKQQLVVENSVLLTSLQQHRFEREKMESEKKIMEQEFENMREKNAMLQKEKIELLEKNRQLKTEVASGEERENATKSKFAALHAELIDLQTKYQVFQEENSMILEEKNSLLKSLLDHRDAVSAAEDQISVILREVLALSNLNLVYECFLTQKVIEQKALSQHLSSNLSRLNGDLNHELGVLRKKFEVKEEENDNLNVATKKMDKELQEIKNANCHLSHQVENSENLLKKKDVELLDMEKRLKAADMLNVEFGRYFEELKMEKQESGLIRENLDRQILELSENCMNQKREIEHLNEENKSFQSVMRSLLHEVEQHKAREQALKSELLDKTNECQLCEAEAAAFYLELQTSSISEELLKSKVSELTGVCKRLDDERAGKGLVIGQMIERINLLEKEIRELKEQLSAYTPMITSLKEDFASLEHTYFLWTNKTSTVGNREQKDVVAETCLEENNYQSLRGSKSTIRPNGVADLLSMQTRIRAVEKLMMEELGRRVKKANLNAEAEAATEMTGRSNLEVTTYPEIDDRKIVMKIKKDNSKRGHNAWRTKSQKRLIMIDIPLEDYKDDPDSNRYCKRDHTRSNDHMLELCETGQHDVTEENKQDSVSMEDVITCRELEKYQNYSSELDTEKELGVDKLELWKARKETASDDGKRKILERLASDSQKLAILKMTLQDLKKKPETAKKSKKAYEIEYDIVKRHIEDVEEAVMQQIGLYDQLAKEIEECTTSSSGTNTMKLEKQRKKITEHARRGSEKIGRLQFEVQNIQYILLKLADVKNNRNSRPTGVFLKDFIRIGKKNSSRRRHKGCACGCSRPSTNED